MILFIMIIGSKNSETLNTTNLLVMEMEDNSFPASSLVTTGVSFGFFAPLIFLFKLSSEKSGDSVSSMVVYLYPNHFTVLPPALVFSHGSSPLWTIYFTTNPMVPRSSRLWSSCFCFSALV